MAAQSTTITDPNLKPDVDTTDQEIALAGADGERAETLLAKAKQQGISVLNRLMKAAVGRLLAKSPVESLTAKGLFSQEEKGLLTDALAATTSTADLLGRTRILEREAAALKRHAPEKFAALPKAVRLFDESPPAEDVKPLPPERALRYFQRLQPRLGLDPERYGPQMRRRAFTLAAATEETLLKRVQDLLGRAIRTGDFPRNTQDQLTGILDAAGVTPRSPAYSEMVTRTNMMDAYNAGAQSELSEVADTFPVWKYANPTDERSRPRHAQLAGQYFPTSASFVEVRGADISEAANCRCVSIPVSIWDWESLKKRGARIADGYADPTEEPAVVSRA